MATKATQLNHCNRLEVRGSSSISQEASTQTTTQTTTQITTHTTTTLTTITTPLNKLSQSLVPSMASSPHLTPDLHNLALPIRGDRGKQGTQERQESKLRQG